MLIMRNHSSLNLPIQDPELVQILDTYKDLHSLRLGYKSGYSLKDCKLCENLKSENESEDEENDNGDDEDNETKITNEEEEDEAR